MPTLKRILLNCLKKCRRRYYLVIEEKDFIPQSDGFDYEYSGAGNLDGKEQESLNESDDEELEEESLLGDYQDYTEEELLKEINVLGEEDTSDAIGPIFELFVRMQDTEKFETLYERHSQIFDELIVVNDFGYPGLDYIPADQLDHFYELSELTEENPEEAVIAIKKAMEKYRHPVYEHLLISAFGYMGMHDEATTLLKNALDKYSNDFMLRIGYGFILLMNDQFDSLKMFMSGFDLRKVVPERNIFHITEVGRFLCLACSYYALTNQLLLATVYQKILDDFTDIPEGTYYQKLTTFNILSPLQWEYIQERYGN